MKIELYSKHGVINFKVNAEDDNERAILTFLFHNGNKVINLQGSTYECDYSSVTSFIFDIK